MSKFKVGDKVKTPHGLIKTVTEIQLGYVVDNTAGFYYEHELTPVDEKEAGDKMTPTERENSPNTVKSDIKFCEYCGASRPKEVKESLEDVVEKLYNDETLVSKYKLLEAVREHIKSKEQLIVEIFERNHQKHANAGVWREVVVKEICEEMGK